MSTTYRLGDILLFSRVNSQLVGSNIKSTMLTLYKH